MSLTVVTAAVIQPLTWLDIKVHRKLDADDERAWVEDILIPAVTLAAIAHTNRQLINATLKLPMDAFPSSSDVALELPRAPLQSVTHVKYIDSTGTLTTWPTTEYVVDTPAGDLCMPGRIWPAYEKSWPEPRCQRNAVEIQFVAGYGASADKVPALLKAGMLLLAGHLFENREAVNVGNIVNEFSDVKRIFDQFKVPKYREGYEAA